MLEHQPSRIFHIGFSQRNVFNLPKGSRSEIFCFDPHPNYGLKAFAGPSLKQSKGYTRTYYADVIITVSCYCLRYSIFELFTCGTGIAGVDHVAVVGRV